MQEQIYTDVKTLLAQMSDKIGQGTEFGWEVVLRQQYVEAVVALSWVVVGLFGMLLTYKMGKYAEENSDEFLGFTSLCAGIVSIALIFINAHTAITHFLNPEFYAIQFFIGLVK